MSASESDDALAKAFASIASVGERAGRGTLGAYELQVFLKRLAFTAGRSRASAASMRVGVASSR